MLKNKLHLVLIGALFLSLLNINQVEIFAQTEVNLIFDHFYDYQELTQVLKSLEKAYPHFVEVVSLGKTYFGRDIWGVILNNPKTGPAEHKPGFYIDGNIHGNEIQGTEVALYTIDFLLKNYGANELATRLLDEKSFYFIPSMNPDARDYFINKATDPNRPRSGLIPYDDDKDGLKDEDGPEDLDGDGSITQMRKKDPLGTHKPHPDDPRVLIPVKAGEKGEYRILGQEGIDNDGDGSINEDGPGGYDMNRNYGFNWQPDYVQRSSGPYPFCFPETKAVRDFLLAHSNIMGAQNFHNTGGMILRGPGNKKVGTYHPADKKVYDYIGKKGEKILPGYKYIVVHKDMYTVYGGSIDFLFNVLGIYTYSNELDRDYSGINSYDKEDLKNMERDELYQMLSKRQARSMEYHDHVLMGEQYTDWKPYKHPLYGDIEIGGLKKFSSRVPPFFKLPETCHRNAAFCLFHADQLPRLHFNRIDIHKKDKGIYQIDLTIENSRVTPTISMMAVQKKLHRTDRLCFKGKNIRIITAGYLTDDFRNITQKINQRDNDLWIASGIPGFGYLKVRVILEGKGSCQLVYDSLKGGYYSREIRLE